MRFVDLFCGIGGFHAALSQLGHECVFACDIDKECRNIYEENWDMTAFADIRDWSNEIDDHEILCAGFPCQPFSKSGSQLGFKDKIRGTLFAEISKIIELKEPNFVLLENVPNLRTHNDGSTMKTIRSVLQQLGYHVRDRILSPHEFGIPQHRPRLFIIAINKKKVKNYSKFKFPRRNPKINQNNSYIDQILDEASEGEISSAEQSILNHWTEFMQKLPEEVTPPSPTWSMDFGRSYSMKDIHPVSKLNKKRLCEILSDEGIEAKTWWKKDRILSNFPPYIRKAREDIPEWKRRFIMKNRIFWNEHSKSFTGNWLETTRTFKETHQKFEWHVGLNANRNLMNHMIHMRPSGIRVSKLNRIPALVAMTQTPIIGPWARRISPREAANAQSFPREFILHEKENIAFKQLGNSVNVAVVKKIASKLMKVTIMSEILSE